MGVYSSLNTNAGKKVLRAKDTKTAKKVANAKNVAKKSGRKAEKGLRPLPKEPIPRFFAHFRWERIKAYWFSKAGLKRIGKIFAACFLIGVIALGALFVYYKSQLKEIQLSNLTIDETVNTYLDRNGVVLWEDKGEADYRLVVEEDEISDYARWATVAIEDKNFYNHPGVDLVALVRATISTLSGAGVQGGSTLTQQLIKQVYFSDEAASENRGGLTRKIKELILSIELEKMYSKEQIITMYLNESPYGGRRNGIESAAQTYFGKSAKDLNLAESALLAAIPNNPAILNPYYTAGNERLIERQHKTLDAMVEMGYVTQEEADVAKEVAILDQIKPESGQYTNMKAPHFVMEVKKQLEAEYGIQAMREGGYTITTTLDYEAQQIAEAAVAEGSKLRYMNNSDNIALASVDVDTGQVVAMVGSIDWNTPVYGEVNATTSPLEPGSSIKPVLDYAPLFSSNGDQVYGPGSILRDENIDSMYCAGYVGACALRNSSGAFYGNLTIRQSLGNSLNIAAVKALAIVGIEDALEITHALGDKTYCADNASQAGLSMAIGSGCNVKMVEHANTYASFARGGVYKDVVYVLEVKDRDGKVLETWEDSAGTRAIDEQVAYEISSILSDARARTITFGSQATSTGFVVPGVWTASKTGTTTTTNSSVAKDSWMMSYSTSVATAVWNGNHDGSALSSSTNQIVRTVIGQYMENVHKQVYAKDGRWAEGDQPKQPSGIQTLTVNGIKDIWPSWYNQKNSGVKVEKVKFNKNNKMRASDCTRAENVVEIEVTTTTDPISGAVVRHVPDGYNYDVYDPCTDKKTSIVIDAAMEGGVEKSVTATIIEGSVELRSYRILVDGVVVENGVVTDAVLTNGLTYRLDGTEKSVTMEVTDADGRKISQDFTSFSWN